MKITDIVDLIVVITLKGRKDRHCDLKQNLESIGLSTNKYFLAEKHSKGPVYGSFDSHMKVIEYAYKNNYKNVLVLEDDVCFDVEKICNTEILSNIGNFIDNNKDWDLFYVGGMPYYKFGNYNDLIIKGEWILAHSYIVNRKCMQYIIKHKRILPFNFCFADYYYIILNKLKKYGLKKSIVFQTDSPSTSQWPIYLSFYNKICSIINQLFISKTTIYVMIRITECFWNYIPEKIMFFLNTLKEKYNKFRYYLYYNYGKEIPYFFFYYFLPF